MPAIVALFIWLKAIFSDESFLDTLRDYLTIFPIEYAEGELRVERQLRATHVLILINVGIHYALAILDGPYRETVLDNLSFLPEKPHSWNLLLSPLTSMFLHGDAGHLWWNMIFLWAFGLVLERRIGWRQFALLYLSTGIISGLISVAIPIIVFQTFTHGIGASGAIVGIMGVFAVRLYFKRLVFPIPILGFFTLIVPLSLKIKVNSLFVVGMYFMMDLQGGILTLLGSPTETNYWAHIGGMVSGILLALRFRFQDREIEDMYTEKALAAIESESGLAQAEKFLRRVLELNPENEAALLALARKKSRSLPSDEGRMLYQRIIRLTLETVPERAAEVFAEYFSIYRLPLDPAAQYRLTSPLQRSGGSDLAARALEVIADDPKTPQRWAERNLFKLAQILEELRLPEAARFRYEQLLERFPDFPKRELVQYKIKRLTSD